MATMPPDPPPEALRLVIDAAALAANWQALDRLSGRAAAGGPGIGKVAPQYGHWQG